MCQAHATYGTKFFHFRTHFGKKCPHQGSTSPQWVHAPPNGSMPPYGKSWIRHCRSISGFKLVLYFRGKKYPDVILIAKMETGLSQKKKSERLGKEPNGTKSSEDGNSIKRDDKGKIHCVHYTRKIKKSGLFYISQ